MGDRRQGHWRRGGGGGRCRRRDLLRDRWCVAETMVSVVCRKKATTIWQWTRGGNGKRAAFPWKMRDIIVVCMTHLSVMAGQAVVVLVPSNQVHQWTDRCEPIRFRRRATSHKDVVTWRYTGRPSSSFDCQRRRSAAVTGSSDCVFQQLDKNSLFYDPRISRPPNFKVKILS